jgi:hypothetical protein
VFGQNPEELSAALTENDRLESTYRRLGATTIDGTQPVMKIADQILAATQSSY